MKRTFEVPFLAPVRTSAKRAYKFGFVALGAAVLFGCPIYSGSSGGGGDYIQCNAQGVCCDETSGGCYEDAGYYGGQDSGSGYDAGYDATTDCSTTGCEPGAVCTVANGAATCVPIPDAGTDGGGTDGTTGPDTSAPDAGSPDAHDAQSLPPFTGCTNDNACVADAGAGARCLDGVCVPAANECSDSTQCPIFGSTQEECVQGVCTPSCSGGATCPTGYACDTGTGVCSVNSAPCGAADGGGTCATGSTCVDEHCVPVCTAGDAGLTCSGTGLVCVDDGCIPNQTPQFICNTEGAQDNCASGSICLHHNCYIACTPGDSGANTCEHADNFNQCKPVQTSTGTYDVCGSSTNLGNQCDPTQGINCMSPAICIDGYCR
jgi:hypothetical protein